MKKAVMDHICKDWRNRNRTFKFYRYFFTCSDKMMPQYLRFKEQDYKWRKLYSSD